MKNIYEVMRQKEQEIARLEKEIEALRVAAPLLVDEQDLDNIESNNKSVAVTGASGPQPIRIAQPAAVNANPQPVQTAKRWP